MPHEVLVSLCLINMGVWSTTSGRFEGFPLRLRHWACYNIELEERACVVPSSNSLMLQMEVRQRPNPARRDSPSYPRKPDLDPSPLNRTPLRFICALHVPEPKLTDTWTSMGYPSVGHSLGWKVMFTKNIFKRIDFLRFYFYLCHMSDILYLSFKQH